MKWCREEREWRLPLTAPAVLRWCSPEQIADTMTGEAGKSGEEKERTEVRDGTSALLLFGMFLIVRRAPDAVRV